ncbi:MAG: hypothetical protein ACKOEO_20325 [Planctomycetaceae bacterium]
MLALNRPLFRSQTVATPGAVEWLQQAALDAALLLSRHENGDWGDLEEEDSATNQAAVTHGDRILSFYNILGTRVYVITEADRSSTYGQRAKRSLNSANCLLPLRTLKILAPQLTVSARQIHSCPGL